MFDRHLWAAVPFHFWSVVFFVFGSMVGSFLNVCIYRLPRDESVVAPRSHCTTCGGLIRWFDNFPVLSYVFLRGRCRACGSPISWRYAVVEILTCGIFVLCYELFFRRQDYANGIAFLYLFCALVVVIYIDLDHMLILDIITYPGVVICLLGSLWGHMPLSAPTPLFRLAESFEGMVVGGGILWAIQFLGMLWYRRQGLAAMGLGDVKLAAFTGAFLGPKFEIAALLFGVAIGGTLAIGLILVGQKGRKDYMPFGPALAIGAAIAPFFGDTVLVLYHLK